MLYKHSSLILMYSDNDKNLICILQINVASFFSLTCSPLPCFINVYQRTKLYQSVVNGLTFQTSLTAKVINWQLCHLETKLRNVGNILVVVFWWVFFFFPRSDIWILIWLSGTSPVSSAGLTALLPNTLTLKLSMRLAYTHPLPSHPCILACHCFWLPCSRKEVCQAAMPSDQESIPGTAFQAEGKNMSSSVQFISLSLQWKTTSDAASSMAAPH